MQWMREGKGRGGKWRVREERKGEEKGDEIVKGLEGGDKARWRRKETQ